MMMLIVLEEDTLDIFVLFQMQKLDTQRRCDRRSWAILRSRSL
jgi:hypothetical protein